MSSKIEPRARRASEPGRTVLSCWAFCRVGDTLVLCTHGDRAPSDEDIERYLQRLATPDFSAILLHTRGGHPTPKQRARIAEFWETCGRPIPHVAVLTDSVVARTVLTAMQWIMRSLSIKAFSADEVPAALQWLQADAPPFVVSETIAGMHAALRMSADQDGVRMVPRPPRAP